MPIQSEKQKRFFQMIAHNPSKKRKKGIGPSQEVAKEMLSKGMVKKGKKS